MEGTEIILAEILLDEVRIKFFGNFFQFQLFQISVAARFEDGHVTLEIGDVGVTRSEEAGGRETRRDGSPK